MSQKKHKKSVLMVRRLTPIVPPGAFTNQLRPNPRIMSQKKPQQRNEKPVLVEMEGERVGGGGGEKVMYSIILLKEDLDNRWITAVCRYKGNRGWQRYQKRSEKNSFNEYVTCTCMSKLCSCHLL